MEAIDFLRRIHIGDTIDETISLPNYPAGDGWSLKIVITNSANKYVIESTADGDDHSIDVAGGGGTDTWTAGKYRWVAFAIKDGKRQRISSGDIEVLPDVEALAADLRSHAEKVLEAIEAVIEGKASTDDYDTTVNGKRLVRYNYEELLKLRNQYRAEVKAQRWGRDKRQGKNAANLARVRFP